MKLSQTVLLTWGKLFVAVGNTELSNIMASDEKVFAVKTFYSSVGSCVACEATMSSGVSFRVAPS
jgi:hypothetical protein